LIRITLLQTAEQEHVLLFTAHHAIFDAWSMGVFLRELAALYEAKLAGEKAVLPELTHHYTPTTLTGSGSGCKGRRWKSSLAIGWSGWIQSCRCWNCRWIGRVRPFRASGVIGSTYKIPPKSDRK
jgi:hypothetical protein